MKLRVVSEIPEKKWDKPTRKSIKPVLENFIKSDAVTAKVEVDPYEYSSSDSLSESISQSVHRARLPIKVIKRGNDVYIRKEE